MLIRGRSACLFHEQTKAPRCNVSSHNQGPDNLVKHTRFQLVIIDAFFSFPKSTLISIINLQKEYHLDS